MWWHLVLAPFVFALLGAVIGGCIALVEHNVTHRGSAVNDAKGVIIGWTVIMGVIGLIAVLAIAAGVDDNIPN